ncbi:MAG: Ribonuclease BN-like family protein [Syntrophorhabdus sp. PtaU1.Bin058]|nr:MAG: Ribonuclease BN-like family protein [Syntrophorhabdus sp. PtaU1.Bin058]
MRKGVDTKRFRQAAYYTWDIIKKVFKKYRKDHGNIIVSSICYYVLLTFIPFTLLSIFILGYVIDLSQPAIHLIKFIKNIIPEPYNTIVIQKFIKELNVISVSKKLSGPLGILFLFFFTSRLFAILRPSFHIIFGKNPKSFIKGKGEELLLTSLFAVVQTMLFFSFIFTIAIEAKVVKALSGTLIKPVLIYVIYIFSMLDMSFTFGLLFLLYVFLTPVRNIQLLLISTMLGTIFWHAGKFLFKYFILHIGKLTAFFGTYGVFIAFLFWIYFSVFILICCAEFMAVMSEKSNRELQPSYLPFQSRPSGELKG